MPFFNDNLNIYDKIKKKAKISTRSTKNTQVQKTLKR